MKIGITECGDAGLDLSWAQKLNTVDGAVIITKNLTDIFCETLLAQHKKQHKQHKIILHAGCTGWGGSCIEPNVPNYMTQLNQLRHLINQGFPKEQCVLRIDPVIPTEPGIAAVIRVLDYAREQDLLPDMRIRISLLDEYRHVKERLHHMGYAPFYPGFQPPSHMVENFKNAIENYVQTISTELCFETCAEHDLISPTGKQRYQALGCISKKDLSILGLSNTAPTARNPQNRHGCLCLSCKTELLSKKIQCPHKCAYCYWNSAK